MKSELLAQLDQLRNVRLLVFGDAMLDRYVYGRSDRTCPEAPVPVLNVEHQEVLPGGAAAAAVFAQKLGATVTLSGVTGEDSDAHTLRQICNEAEIEITPLLSLDDRPTTRKDRFMGMASGRHLQQVLRVDHESTAPLAPFIETELCNFLSSSILEFDAVLVSDYAKGTCTPRLIQTIVTTALASNIPVLVDPGRGRPANYYHGATLLKPNRQEAAQLVGHVITGVHEARGAARELHVKCGVQQVVITLDCDGCVSADGEGVTHILTDQREVYDITSAGDMFMAMLGVSMASECDINACLGLANAAAGLCVERLGSSGFTLEELRSTLVRSSLLNRDRDPSAKIVPTDEIGVVVDLQRQNGQTIVFTNGCFDLLHVGHAKYLREASQMGDLLIVAVNDNASVERLKGVSRPVNDQTERAVLLAALECVDFVVVFNEDTPCNLLTLIRPDILVKGGDHTPDSVVGADIVRSYGGTVCVAEHIPGVSTSTTIQKLGGGEHGCLATNNH